MEEPVEFDAAPGEDGAVEVGEPVEAGSGFESEPRSRARMIAPMALVTGLCVAVGAAFLLPRSANDDVAEATTAPITQQQRQAQVSRSLVRPSVGASTPASTPTPSPSASATPSISPKPSATATSTPSRTPRSSASPTPAARSSKPASASASASARAAGLAMKSSASAKRPSASSSPTRAAVTGHRYATATVNVRKEPSTQARRITTLDEGERISVTDVRHDGWRQVRVDGQSGWVRSDYLSLARPTKKEVVAQDDRAEESRPTPKPTRTSEPRPTDDPSPSGNACRSTAVERGLTSNAVAVHRASCANFPFVKSYGGVRPSADAHGSGHALDIMISGEAGWQVARWARANASSLGITEVIYAQKIWTTQRASEGWRSMGDRGSATANHFDHVHVTVR